MSSSDSSGRVDDLLPGPLVGGGWLASHLGDVRVVDVRWYLDGRSGREAYLGGHVPGAVWVDIDTELSDPSGPGGRHPLPSPERFADAMSRASIGGETPVVAYDDTGGAIAARLWWLLSMLDHPVAVLDGGLAAWPGPLETGSVDLPAAAFTARPFPVAELANADQVAEAAGQTDTVVLDARPANRYAHGDPSIDPRPGHVPGAVSAPWSGNLGPDGRLLSPDELRARFEALGVSSNQEVVAYCGSGVTACHDLLALTVAGVGSRRRLYPGSWSEWGADPSRPAAEGPDPGS